MVTHPGPTWRNQNFATEVTGHMGWQIDLFSTVSSGVDTSYPILRCSTAPASVQFVYALAGNRNLKGTIEYFIALLVELFILIPHLRGIRTYSHPWVTVSSPYGIIYSFVVNGKGLQTLEGLDQGYMRVRVRV
jgi:hypothetical protein